MPLVWCLTQFGDAVHGLVTFRSDGDNDDAAGIQHLHQPHGQFRGSAGHQDAVVLEPPHLWQPVETVAQKAVGRVMERGQQRLRLAKQDTLPLHRIHAGTHLAQHSRLVSAARPHLKHRHRRGDLQQLGLPCHGIRLRDGLIAVNLYRAVDVVEQRVEQRVRAEPLPWQFLHGLQQARVRDAALHQLLHHSAAPCLVFRRIR